MEYIATIEITPDHFDESNEDTWPYTDDYYGESYKALVEAVAKVECIEFCVLEAWEYQNDIKLGDEGLNRLGQDIDHAMHNRAYGDRDLDLGAPAIDAMRKHYG